MWASEAHQAGGGSTRGISFKVEFSVTEALLGGAAVSDFFFADVPPGLVEADVCLGAGVAAFEESDALSLVAVDSRGVEEG